MPLLPPIDFRRFIDEHRASLQPPVGNKEVYRDHEFIVMIVGGPNARTDFHVDPGEEFFHQIEGDMTLRVVDDGVVKDIEIKEGHIFLLPAFVPHSPQRRANTVGLVIERRRRAGELDAFEWYCQGPGGPGADGAGCGHKLYREELQLGSIVDDLPPIFTRYEADIAHRTCSSCGTVMPTRA